MVFQLTRFSKNKEHIRTNEAHLKIARVLWLTLDGIHYPHLEFFDIKSTPKLD